MYLFILHELGKDTRGFHGSLVVTIIEWIPPPHAFFSFFAGTTCVLNNVTIHSFQTLQFLFQIQFTNHTPFLSFFPLHLHFIHFLYFFSVWNLHWENIFKVITKSTARMGSNTHFLLTCWRFTKPSASTASSIYMYLRILSFQKNKKIKKK